MPSKDSSNKAFVPEMIQPFCFAVSLTCGIDCRKVFGLPVFKKRCSSAMAISSANPEPTNPPVATLSPSFYEFNGFFSCTDFVLFFPLLPLKLIYNIAGMPVSVLSGLVRLKVLDGKPKSVIIYVLFKRASSKTFADHKIFATR